MLSTILIALVGALIVMYALSQNESPRVVAASYTPTLETAVAAVASETPSPLPVIPTEPAPVATATSTPPSEPAATAVPPSPTIPPAPATPTLSVTRVPTAAAPTDVPRPQIVYEARWELGLEGWLPDGSWSVIDGALERAQEPGMASILAPHLPEHGYAIEADIEAIGDDLATAVVGFVVVDGSSGQARVIAVPAESSGMRTYRLEVDDSGMKFLVDGVMISGASSEGLVAPGGVGLFVAGAGARVYSFVVIE